MRSRRALIGLTIVGITVPLVLRLALYHGASDYNRVYYAPDTRADALVIGCLLALTITTALRAPFPGVLALLATGMLIWLSTFGRGAFFFQAGLMLAAVASAVLVGYSLRPGPLGRALLTAVPVMYIGRISYGLYLYHYVIFPRCTATHARPALPHILNLHRRFAGSRRRLISIY